MTSSDPHRRAELQSALDEIRVRIDQARKAAGRSDDVGLVVVTKTFPASDVDILAELGVRDVGENRDQEAKAKVHEVQASNLRWHMIGRLQRNKVGSVARWADVVESVDRLELVDPLAEAVSRAERPHALDVLIQVNLDPSRPSADHGEGSFERGGVQADRVLDIAGKISARPELRLSGVMAVAPHPDTGVDPLEAFARLAQVSADLRTHFPQASTISAGMSHDLEQAVACGTTQVRIGGAILGQRPAVQ